MCNNYGIILYLYEDTIKNNFGLLHDEITNCEIEEKDSKFYIDFIDIIKDNYKIKINSKSYPMQKFFDERIEKRLLNFYSRDNWVDSFVDLGFKERYTTKQIINECVSYFKLDRIYPCVLSHGDLNTLNLGTKPIFFDYITSGYNYLTAEVATFCCSILILDLYFTPKYHSNSYKNHEKRYISNEIDIEFEKRDKYIKISSRFKTTKIRKEMILYYLKNLKYNEEDLIYFIIMRLLTVLNINNYSEKDKLYSIFLIHYFYIQLKNYSFEKIINKTYIK